MKKVVVASKNPVKLQAALGGFEKMFPEEKFEVEGVSVESGVKVQPMSDEETLQGAINRVSNAVTQFSDADYWIGLEAGIEEIDEQMRSFAWIVVKSVDQMGKARSATFYLPKKIVELIRQGKELGDADDEVFGHSNSKQKNGAVGILTGDVVVRASLYEMAVILALVPFKNSELY